MNNMELHKKHVIWLTAALLLCSCLFWLLLGHSAQAAGKYPRAIAHGCGAIQGNTVTNSEEALLQAIENGYQYIEVDMVFTTDGQIAMLHDWQSSAGEYLGLGQNKAVSFAQYQKCKVLNNYTPLTMDRLAAILQANPQVSIVTDTKENNVALLTAIQKKYPQVVKQIIPQIYHYEEYAPVKALGYDKIILTLYQMNDRNGDRIAKFVKDHQIYAVTMSIALCNTNLAKTLQNYGIAVYMHTVNTLQQTVQALSAGAYGVYTDNLLPEEVTYPSWQYYLARSTDSTQQLNIELQQGDLRLNMRSCNQKGRVAYYIGDQLLVQGDINQVLQVKSDAIATGKHMLTARLYDGAGQQVSTKQYYLWKDQSCVLLLALQCQHVLEQFDALGDFSQALEGQQQRVQQIAQKSVFIKGGSAVYYNNGRTGLYLSGSTLLPAVAADSQGNIYASLHDTAVALGVSSTQLNSTTKAVDVRYQGKTYQAGVTGVTRYYQKNVPVMKTAVKLYRNRTIASGAFYQELTGRAFVQQEGYLILLPQDIQLHDGEQQALLSIAKRLYQ